MTIKKEDLVSCSVDEQAVQAGVFNERCYTSENIHNVTHLHNAINIAREAQISPKLIYDTYRLKDARIPAVYLSPVTYPSYIFGNVRFSFNWNNFLEGKRIYWVEQITGYDRPLCRFLVTTIDRSVLFEAYDPDIDLGPWMRRNGINYYNNKIYLEILSEEAIQIETCIDLETTTHYRTTCILENNKKFKCADKDLDDGKAAARLVAGLCVKKLSAFKGLYTKIENGSCFPESNLLKAWNNILSYSSSEPTGTITESDTVAVSLVLAFLYFFYSGDRDNRIRIQSLFASKKDFWNTCKSVIESHYGIKGKFE